MTYDLIIIGGGPAGITAGIFSIRKRIKTLLITKEFLGQTAKAARVYNYPGFFGIKGRDLMKRFEEHLKKMAALNREIFKILRNEEAAKIDLSFDGGFLIKTEKGGTFKTKAIIVAVGGDPRPLEAGGEKDFIGKGVSYCLFDRNDLKKKSIAIIGGGNSCFESVLELARVAKRIFIFEKSEELKADEYLAQEVNDLIKKGKKIEILFNTEVKKIEGSKKVENLVFYNLKTKKTFQVPIDYVLIQIGVVPATGFLRGLVDFNGRDEIIVNPETCETSRPGIFAAGDADNGQWKQIVVAAGEGAKAALAAYDYLKKMDNF